MRTRTILLLGLLLGLVTAAGTTFVNRPFQGRDLTGETNCEKTDLNPYGLCYRMHPQGGFPLIHISDTQEGANAGALGPEDELYPISFAGNVLAYMTAWVAALGIVSLLTARRRPTVQPEPAQTPPAPERHSGLQINIARGQAPAPEAVAETAPSEPDPKSPSA